jgi:subtilase family serine protease
MLSSGAVAVPELSPASGSGSAAKPNFTAGPTGYTPLQLQHAYGFDQIFFNGTPGDGAGMTIAIVDAFDDPNIGTHGANIPGDLHQFDLAFKLPDPPSFTKINQFGSTSNLPAPNKGWITEIALDVEWAHAMAPGANIVLVEANSASGNDLYQAVDTARNYAGVNVVSMSWGGRESFLETALDSHFTTPNGHGGVTFVVASGDSGAPAEYPSASPNVLSVGGTTLSLDTDGNITGETTWKGSGGGFSAHEPQPPYQVGIVNAGKKAHRATPDVAYDADPNTGVGVYDSYNNGTVTPWGQWGGTSLGAPQWSALIAIADQGRHLAVKGSLDGATQTLPALYSMSANDFNDITTGKSGPPRISAGPGYDLATGRGSPIANLIVADLVSSTLPGPAFATPGFTVSGPAVESPFAVTPKNLPSGQIFVSVGQDYAALFPHGDPSEGIVFHPGKSHNSRGRGR